MDGVKQAWWEKKTICCPWRQHLCSTDQCEVCVDSLLPCFVLLAFSGLSSNEIHDIFSCRVIFKVTNQSANSASSLCFATGTTYFEIARNGLLMRSIHPITRHCRNKTKLRLQHLPWLHSGNINDKESGQVKPRAHACGGLVVDNCSRRRVWKDNINQYGGKLGVRLWSYKLDI